MMHCDKLQNQLDDYLAGNLSESDASVVTVHLQHCAECRHSYLQTQKLLLALHTMPLAPPPTDYAQRVLAFLPHQQPQPAPTRQRIGWYATGFASALILMLAIGFIFIRSYSLNVPDSSVALTLPVSQVRIQNVNLMFHSPVRITHATLRIELPTGIEINGYARQRVLQWQTTLQRGNNRLVLPLLVTGHVGGMLTARLSHNGHSRDFKVHIVSKQTDSQIDITQQQTV